MEAAGVYLFRGSGCLLTGAEILSYISPLREGHDDARTFTTGPNTTFFQLVIQNSALGKAFPLTPGDRRGNPTAALTSTVCLDQATTAAPADGSQVGS